MSSENRLSHYDAAGEVRMVDVGAKTETARMARAHAFVRMNAQVLESLHRNPKGDPLEVARIAGILAAQNRAPVPIAATKPATNALPSARSA